MTRETRSQISFVALAGYRGERSVHDPSSAGYLKTGDLARLNTW
jgi:hypothetical protein